MEVLKIDDWVLNKANEQFEVLHRSVFSKKIQRVKRLLDQFALDLGDHVDLWAYNYSYYGGEFFINAFNEDLKNIVINVYYKENGISKKELFETEINNIRLS